jgi:hypothetical protein
VEVFLSRDRRNGAGDKTGVTSLFDVETLYVETLKFSGERCQRSHIICEEFERKFRLRRINAIKARRVVIKRQCGAAMKWVDTQVKATLKQSYYEMQNNSTYEKNQ